MKQVEKTHYEFGKYLSKPRWASMWHQCHEVTRLSPRRLLEIGPGPGVFKALMMSQGVQAETLDLDPSLNPDYVASVFDMPFKDDEFDMVCAFQMLEHLPFDDSLRAIKEMTRVASSYLVISLPDAAKRFGVSMYLTKLGSVSFSIPIPWWGKVTHEFDGQHYWEVNKTGYALERVMAEFSKVAPIRLKKTFTVQENPYHRFFVYEVIK